MVIHDGILGRDQTEEGTKCDQGGLHGWYFAFCFAIEAWIIYFPPDKGRKWRSSYRSAARTTGTTNDVPMDYIREVFDLRHGTYSMSWIVRPPPGEPYHGQSTRVAAETCASPPLHLLRTKDNALGTIALHPPRDHANFSTLAGAFVDDSPCGAKDDFSGAENLPGSRNSSV